MTVTVTVTRFRERFTKCGSCRSDAMFMVWRDGERFATACVRHRDVWERRANA